MKKILLIAIIVFANITFVNGHELNNNLEELAKIYRNFMFRNAPSINAYKDLEEIKRVELKNSVKFIKETITHNNQLATTEYLKLPNEETLKYLYIIRRITWNLSEESPKDNNLLITELTKKQVLRYELIDNYYDMLFSGVANKNQPFDLSSINFQMKEYGLKDDTEKGVFFLKAMSLCGTAIWGYMNIVKPPNYSLALNYIEKYPKFNGQPYYQYLDFSFPDFEMEIEKDKGNESYKGYHINKYYNTLLSHFECLNQKKKYREEGKNLLLGSILKEKSYYKYSEKKELLESFFTTVKK